MSPVVSIRLALIVISSLLVSSSHFPIMTINQSIFQLIVQSTNQSIDRSTDTPCACTFTNTTKIAHTTRWRCGFGCCHGPYKQAQSPSSSTGSFRGVWSMEVKLCRYPPLTYLSTSCHCSKYLLSSLITHPRISLNPPSLNLKSWGANFGINLANDILFVAVIKIVWIISLSTDTMQVCPVGPCFFTYFYSSPSLLVSSHMLTCFFLFPPSRYQPQLRVIRGVFADICLTYINRASDALEMVMNE